MLAAFVEGQSETPGATGAPALQQQAAGALADLRLADEHVGRRRLCLRRDQQRRRADRGLCADAAERRANGGRRRLPDRLSASPVTSPSVSTITGAQMQSFLNNQFAASVQRRQLDFDLVVGQRYADEQSDRRQPDGRDLGQRESSGASRTWRRR